MLLSSTCKEEALFLLDQLSNLSIAAPLCVYSHLRHSIRRRVTHTPLCPTLRAPLSHSRVAFGHSHFWLLLKLNKSSPSGWDEAFFEIPGPLANNKTWSAVVVPAASKVPKKEAGISRRQWRNLLRHPRFKSESKKRQTLASSFVCQHYQGCHILVTALIWKTLMAPPSPALTGLKGGLDWEAADNVINKIGQQKLIYLPRKLLVESWNEMGPLVINIDNLPTLLRCH